MQKETAAKVVIDSTGSHREENPVVAESLSSFTSNDAIVESMKESTTYQEEEIEVVPSAIVESAPASALEPELVPEQVTVILEPEMSESSEPQQPVANLTTAIASSNEETIAVVAQEVKEEEVEEESPLAEATTNTSEQPAMEQVEQKEDEPLPPRSFSPAYSCDSPSPSASPALSRVSSRQDLRRKSSFFNSKEIVISDQRYSTSAYDSMRPIADPRFKSRFQNVLSQWKARSSSS